MQRMDEALASGQPVIAYFYAAWCPSCYHLKEKTYSDPRVIEALSSFIKLKADLSYSHSEKTSQISNRHKIRSFPTIIFFDSSGQEIQRVSGFLAPDQFLALVNYLQTNAAKTG